MKSPRRPLWIALGVIVAGAGVAAFLLWPRKDALPKPGTPEYLHYVRVFNLGVAAVDAGRDELAKMKLEEATQLIPGEPAAWANLGLLQMRKNNLEQAAKDLQRARDLAGDDAEIEALLGALAEKQGRQADAVKHYRKTAEARPNDIPLLYTLAQAISREGGAESDAEYQKLMARILKLQPNNLRVLLQHAGAAFRVKDDAGLRESLVRLTKLAPAWTVDSREVLEELRKAVDAAPGDVVPLLQDLDRVLKAEHGYLRDSRAIVPHPGVVGSPIYTFLRLTPPRPTPAPPDRELAFDPRPIAGAEKSAWTSIRPVWLIDEKQRAILVDDAIEGGLLPRAGDALTSTLFAADATTVRRLDADAPMLPFPGGVKAVPPSAAGVLDVDFDNDFRVDLLLAGAGGLRFWRQQPTGAFLDVGAKTGLKAEILNDDCFGAWAADVEMDGDLDLIVARRSGQVLVLRNNGDGTFKPLDPFPGVNDVRAFTWIDLDNDGAPDAVFLDAKGKAHVFANERSGQFAAWPLPDDIGAFVAIAGADIDADGVFDLIGLRSTGQLARISDQEKRKRWQIAELAKADLPADTQPGVASLFVADLDNNGALDIVVSAGASARVFLADETGAFAPLKDAVALRVSAVVDLDRDGRLDLVGLSEKGSPTKAMNQGKKNYRWQALWPIANPKAGDNRINSFALGSDVEIRTGLVVQKQFVTHPGVHFGLGEYETADVARIVWPNGVPQWEFDVPTDRFFAAAQRLSGSCPFLFTWDGEAVRFVGDFMWSTPLGMYVNGQNVGDFPQTTEWLKIAGEHLVPRDGHYDVRVHANLWEVDFFDKLALLVVDHPPDTELHVDERFFLTPTPPSLHVTTPARPIAAARDHLGQDVTDLVRAIDGRYVDRAGRGRFQGVMKDHWIEIDLDETIPGAGPLLLIARGWLHPTNSSINFALAQGTLDGPRPLSLEVPDGKGGWKTARPALGFPAGKNKTMLVRLDDLPGIEKGEGGVAHPRRIRLRTTMEIYWDYFATARDLDPALARLQRPTPTSVELRYRGILEMARKDKSSPEVPVYDKVTKAGQPWRDLTGMYTRFGDVRELVEQVDDRYIIANAGDEIAFRYPVPAAPPPGWKRDFIWESDGWTRDGDLNTRYGNRVLPLPAHGVNSDERPPTRLRDDPVFRRFSMDWARFHTRYVSDEEFGRGLRVFGR